MFLDQGRGRGWSGSPDSVGLSCPGGGARVAFVLSAEGSVRGPRSFPALSQLSAFLLPLVAPGVGEVDVVELEEKRAEGSRGQRSASQARACSLMVLPLSPIS